jgi:hypothetical protein
MIWRKTLALAKQKGLQETDNVRHFERLRFHCETLVVEDAIDRVLDSERSPLDIDDRFKIEDILEFEKHLYGTTEHASMALGLLQHQWENPVISAVERFLKQTCRAKLDAKDIGKPDPIPYVQAEMSYYIVTRFESTMQSNSSAHDREKAMQQTEQLRRLALFAYKRMNPQPSLDEVIFALETLSALQIDVDSNTKIGEKVRIPALAFSRDGELMVAVHLLQNYENDRLRSCLKSVLNHKFTNKKNILYGRVHDKQPYRWQAMRVAPVEDKKLTMENPKYFPSEVLQLTYQLCQNVSSSSRREAEAVGREQERKSFFSRFGDTSHEDVNMDLDERAAEEQAYKLGLRFLPPTRDAPNYDTSPSSFTKAVLAEVADHDELGLYPKCMHIDSTKRMAERAKKAANPEIFSMRDKVKKRKREEADDDEAEKRRREEADEEESKSDNESRAGDVDMQDLEDADMCSDHDLEGESDDDAADVEPAAFGSAHQPFSYSAFPNVQQPPPQAQQPFIYSAFPNVPQLPFGAFGAQMSRIASSV